VALLPDSYEDLKDSEAVSRPLPEQKASSGLRWTNLVLCLFVVADLVIFLLVFRQSSVTALGDLKFQDTYIGLKALYGSGKVKPSPRKPIVVVPRVQTQVSSAEPSKLAPADYHQWLDGFGMLSSRNRHLQVSSDIRTIMQFRAMDFGMEKCAISLRLPPLLEDERDPHAFKLADNSGEMRLDVCKSDLSKPLDVQSLSFSTRPACREHVGTVVVKAGEESSMLPEFPCTWASYHTYEVSCAPDSPHCMLDVWSNENATWGFVMHQYQTI